MKSSKKLLASVILGLMTSGAQAAVEDLNADNSTYATAQYVGNLSSQALINVFGFRGSVYGGLINDDSNADFYSFDVTAPITLTLNVFTPDGPTFGDDPILGLFGTNGTLLNYDDDAGAGYDAFLQLTIAAPGQYIAAVGGFSDFSFTGGGSTDFSYNLQAQAASTTVVPVPAAVWLFSSSLMGWLSHSRRNKAIS